MQFAQMGIGPSVRSLSRGDSVAAGRLGFALRSVEVGAPAPSGGQKRNSNRAPPLSLSPVVTVQSCASAIACTMESPSPVPAVLVV